MRFQQHSSLPDTVTSEAIVDRTIRAEDIANGAVGADQLATGGVTGPKIAGLSIGTHHLVDHSVTVDKLAGVIVDGVVVDEGVTAPKIEPESNGVYNVRAYGATGDGVTGDYTAIAAAITAAAATGGRVHFPQGTYVTGTTVSVPAGVRVSGERATLVRSTAGALMSVAGDHVVIEGMRLSAEAASIALNISTNCDDVTVRGCEFVSGAQGVTMNAASIGHVLIADCVFAATGYGVLVNANASDLDGLIIRGCRFIGCTADAIEINTPGASYVGAKNIVIANNLIRQDQGSSAGAGFGIGLAGCSRVTVTGNVIEAARYQAIHVEDECRHIAIVANIIDGTGNTPADATNSGIYVIDGDHITIADNQVYACNDLGIQCNFAAGLQARKLVVANNTVTACGASGIAVGGDSPLDAIVTGNVSTSNGVDGIRIAGSNARSMRVTNNICRGNGAYGIYCSSTTSHGVSIAGNTLYENTSGSYGSAALGSHAIHVGDEDTSWTAVSDGSNVTPWADTFALGKGAKGSLVVLYKDTANNTSYSRIFDVSWDGTTLTQTTVASHGVGTATGSSLQMNGTVLQIRGNIGASGRTVQFKAHFAGTRMVK